MIKYIILDLSSWELIFRKTKKEVGDVVGVHPNNVREGFIKGYIVKRMAERVSLLL